MPKNFKILPGLALLGTLSLTGCMSLITGGPLVIPCRATGTKGVGDAMHRLVVNAGQVSRYTVND